MDYKLHNAIKQKTLLRHLGSTMSKLSMKISKPDFDQNWLLESIDGEWSLWQYNRYWQAKGRVYGFRNNHLEILIESDNMKSIINMMKDKMKWLSQQCRKSLVKMEDVNDIGIELDMETIRTGNIKRLMRMIQQHDNVDNEEDNDLNFNDDLDFDDN